MDIPIYTCSADDEVIDIEICRPDGSLFNTVRMTECDAAWTCAVYDQQWDAGAGWSWRRRPDPEPEAEVPSEPQVPASVTRRQARQALLLAGLLDDVPAAIARLDDGTPGGAQQMRMAQIEWEDSLEFERARPLVIQIAAAVGLDADALDALFITAAGL